MDDTNNNRWKSPNVIIIIVDDLGVADVSFSARRLNKKQQQRRQRRKQHGNASIPTDADNDVAEFTPTIETPELDELAEDPSGGVQLANAFTHMLCGPSRAALVTGRLAHKLGNPFPMVAGGSLHVKYKTIGHEFQLRGYSTHFIGKWGIDYPKPPNDILFANRNPTYEMFNGNTPGMGPTERGFDTFYGLYSSGHNHYTKEIVYEGAIDWHKHNQTHKLDYPDIDHHPNEYSTDLFTKEAIEIINSWSPNQPGFLHLSYTAPHDPLQAPEEDMNHPSCRRIQGWRRKTFCGMVTAIDRNVGEIKRALRAGSPGLAENTIIVFTTDNGGAPAVGGFNYPFRGQKGTVYEGGFRTPAFMYIPNDPSLGANVRNSHYLNAIHLVDFGPTLLGIVDRVSGKRDKETKEHGLDVVHYEALGDDIDGVDHTEYIFDSLAGQQFHHNNFSSINNEGEITTTTTTATGAKVPRNSTVLEHNAFFDHAAYLEGDYKLILGNAGRAARFNESIGRWYDDDGRPRYIIEEAACDIFDKMLGPNWFVYGWGMRFMIDAFFNALEQPPSKKANRDVAKTRMARQMSAARNNPIGSTIPITDDRLPKADFKNYDPREVQLYNLDDDPFEDNNIAYQNQELVNEMLGRLIDQVKDDPGHHYSVQKFFMEMFIFPMARYICGAGFATVLFILILLYKRFVNRKMKKEKTE